MMVLQGCCRPDWLQTRTVTLLYNGVRANVVRWRKVSVNPAPLAAKSWDQLSSWRSRLRTSPSMSASRVRKSSISRTAWITVE